MKFNSFEFLLFFLPIVVVGFFTIARLSQRGAAIAWLVGASFFFYAYWNPAYLALILVSILFNYVVGGQINAARVRHAFGRAKGIALFGIAANLGLLGYYKYSNFFVESMNAAFGMSWHIEHIALPLAISFFTFQQIAFLVDVWRGEAQDYSFLHYCLFVSFFPQLIAGPIVHHKEMMPQFDVAKKFLPSAENFAVGLSVFIIGLAKKTLVADELALYADPVFAMADNGGAVSFVEAWGGILAYTFQIYFDFSGYSDMAIGLARIFGIRLPVNFFSPYRATSIIGFWRCWHMTLSRFLRDYVYIPLGGNRKGASRRGANVMTTMLLGGLWHGAGWNFVIWGGLHGLYLVANQAWRAAGFGMGDGRISRLTCGGTTFLAVVVAWVFFRAETFAGAKVMLLAMSGQSGIYLPKRLMNLLAPFHETLAPFGIQAVIMPLYGGVAQVGVLASAMLIAFMLPNTQQIVRNFHLPPGMTENVQVDASASRLLWRPVPLHGVMLGMMAAIAFFAVTRTSAFLYFNF